MRRRAAPTGRRRDASRRPAPSLALLLALALPLGVPARRGEAGDPDTGSSACGVWGFLDEEDETLRVAYDGLRRGLEEANLPRICLERVERDDAEAWAKAIRTVVERRPPFVVALGRRSGARLAAARLEVGPGRRLPCVYVDAGVSVGGRVLPAALQPPLPCALVRAEVAMEGWGPVLKGLLPGRPQPTVLLPWSAESREAAALRREVAAAAGFEAKTLSEGTAADAILDWAPGLGEVVEPFASTVARSRSLRIPLLTGDRGRFARGAAVVRSPDADLLGRVAAEAARRLLAGDGADAPLRMAVRTTEVWVDLEAADAEGLTPPLAFLAAVDRLRRPLGSAPPAGGSR